MIYLGDPATDFEEKVLLASTYVQSGQAFGVGDAAEITSCWGNEYFDAGAGNASDPRNHGILVQLSRQKFDRFVAATSYATLRVPHLDVTVSLTFGGWINLESKLLLNGQELTGDCSNWAWAVTSLEWWVNGVLQWSYGATSKSGTNYDPRLNQQFLSVGGGANILVVPTWAECDTAIHETSVAGSLSGGFRYKPAGVWTEPLINLDAQTPPTISGCNCALAVLNVTSSVDPPTVYRNNLSFDGGVTVYGTDLGTTNCTCEFGGGSEPFLHFTRTLRAYGRAASLTNCPEDAEIFNTHRKRAARCYDYEDVPPIPDWTEVESTTLEVTTYAPYYVSANNMVGTSHCWDHAQPIPICPGVHEGDDWICDGPAPTWCFDERYAQLDWPTKPDCGSVIGNPWTVCDDRGRYHKLTIEDGNAVYRRSKDSRGAFEIDRQITSDGIDVRGRMAWDSNTQRIMALIERPVTGTEKIYETHSDDDGYSWSSLVLAFNSAYQPDCDWSKGQGAQVRGAFRYDSGTSGPGTIVAQFRDAGDTSFSGEFTLKDASNVNLSVTDKGFHICLMDDGARVANLCCVIQGETASSDWYSTDDCRTWKRYS